MKTAVVTLLTSVLIPLATSSALAQARRPTSIAEARASMASMGCILEQVSRRFDANTDPEVIASAVQTACAESTLAVARTGMTDDLKPNAEGATPLEKVQHSVRTIVLSLVAQLRTASTEAPKLH